MVRPSRVARSLSASVTSLSRSGAEAGLRAVACIRTGGKLQHEPAHDRGHGPVAAVGLRGQERLRPGGILEGHPDARVDGPLLVQRQELTQQG